MESERTSHYRHREREARTRSAKASIYCPLRSNVTLSITDSSMTVYFPFEILTAIFEQVDDARDLYHVRTATRTLCAAATPLAFRVLSVTSTAGSAKNLGRLFDVPDIAAHVREITYRDTGADRRGKMQNLKRGASSPHYPTIYHNELTTHLCAPGVAGSPQSEPRPSPNWPFCFLAFTSCPGLRPSI